VRIFVAQLNFKVGDLDGNTEKIKLAIGRAKKLECQIVLFPELSITGYPPEDLLLLPHFIKNTEKKLLEIARETRGIAAIVGLPRINENAFGRKLFNSAAVLYDGEILGFQDKTLLPTYDVFDEARYFEPALERKPFTLFGKKVAITICEDIWQRSKLVKEINYGHDPLDDYAGVDLALNLSSSPFSKMKAEKRIQVVSSAAKALKAPVILCNQVGGNDSLIFDGYSVVCDKSGTLALLGKGFAEDDLIYENDTKELSVSFNAPEETYKALVLGLKDYFQKQGFKSAVLGVSGGIDSALVACIASAALGPENVLGVMMPSRFSTPGSFQDATELLKNLGLRSLEISIESPFQSYLNLLDPIFAGLPQDITEENLQARIRGMILMALSNKFGHIVLSTGNKSELAMGYSTLYGDLCGGLSVINDLTKREVYQLARYINRNGIIIPQNSIDKPPSAELRENQKDSDTLPDYEIVDTVLEAYMYRHESAEEIAREHGLPIDLVRGLIKKIHLSEYKRRQSPPGLRVTDKAFSVGRRFPIVQG